MTCRKHLKAGVALAALVTGLAIGGGAAQASALFLDPAGSSDFIPGGQTNEILESVYGAGVFSRDGYYGSTIRLKAKSAVTFTFLGFEAGYDNEFLLDADGNGSFDLIFSNKTGGTADINGKSRTVVDDTYTVVLDPANFTDGIIPFMFKADVNGAKPDLDSVTPAFDTGRLKLWGFPERFPDRRQKVVPCKMLEQP